MTEAHKQFSQIKADLGRQQREIYDVKAGAIFILDGKIVYIRDDLSSHLCGQSTRFIRNFDDPYLVTGHTYGRSDLLNLKHVSSGKYLPHPVNIEKSLSFLNLSPMICNPANNAIMEMEAALLIILHQWPQQPLI